MVCYQSVPDGARGMRFCGQKTGDCWEESWHEMYPDNRTQKYSKDDKETVCCYVTYAFWTESTLCSCLNVKELLAWNRPDIWRLSDCNGIQIHNHLVCKWKLNRLTKLAKWLKWLNSWVFVYELSGCGFKSRYDDKERWWHTNWIDW